MAKRKRQMPQGRKRIKKQTPARSGTIRAKLPTDEKGDPKGDYSVGRGKPPAHGKFKKGDGRKRPGRPKGSKNIATIVMEAAQAQIEVTIDGKKRKISKAQSAAIQLANAGAMGNPKLLLKFIDLIARIEAGAEAARPSEYPFSDADKTVIHETFKRLRPYDERAND
jgi:hypothetical protein